MIVPREVPTAKAISDYMGQKAKEMGIDIIRIECSKAIAFFLH